MDHEGESQLASRCRLEWGHEGARRAAARGDVVVVVDTLRFSTAAAVAVSRGATVHLEGADAGPQGGRNADALSPQRYEDLAPGAHVILRSPNGATCCLQAKDAPRLFVAAPVNARAAAEAVGAVLRDSEWSVSVVACGERRNPAGEDGPLRFAIEDYLGAGAILYHLDLPKSAEARVCQGAFEASRDALTALLLDSASGWELREKGREEDVRYAARLDALETVPVLRGVDLEAFRPGEREMTDR